MYEITKNLLAGEALRVFEHQAKAKVYNTTIECKPFIEGMVTYFFPTKVPQFHKSYLLRGLYKRR